MDHERNIAMAVKNLSNQFHRYMTSRRRFFAATVDGVERMTDIQGRIINYLYSRGDRAAVYQKDIEKHFNIRRSTATNILKRIERNGFIRREVSEIDARMKTLSLTELARSICPLAEREILKAERQAAKGLSDSDLTVFFRVIETISSNIA